MVRRLLADRRVRYLLVGGLASAIYYATFAGLWLVTAERVSYLLVAVAANLVSAVASYPVQRRVVFRAAGSWIGGFLRFYLLALWALLFMLGGLPLLVEAVHLDVLLAQAIIIVASPVINYQGSRRWVFNRRAGRHDAGLRASTTRPLAATPAAGCRASTRSSSLNGDSSHISGTSAR